MKRRQLLIIGIFLIIVLLLAFLTIARNMSREEDLFKQLPEETLAKSEGAVLTAEASTEGEVEIVKEEEILPVTDATQRSSDGAEQLTPGQSGDRSIEESDSEQQEAAMGTSEAMKTIDTTETIMSREASFFSMELTDEIKERINGKSYGENCTVPYEDLRYVNVLYWGFDDQTHTGELIVNRAIAEDIVAIFTELYEANYPIERMVLVDEYDADDNTSMAANNSSAFNYRVIEGTNRISKHSYGLAVDINPLYNPYIHEVDGERVVTPVEGAMYEDRTLDCPYYIREGDLCYEAFIQRGFTWGGDWKNQKDYQHFQKESAVTVQPTMTIAND